jgi:glycosyltransferase involved in cell wall biosynthesis
MKNKKKAIVCVSNDLITDNRVDKTCLVLGNLNYEVILVGRKKRNSPQMNQRNYAWKRFRLPFEKGPFFYFTLNLRLFLFLIGRKVDLIYANDLDTLAPCYFVSKVKNTRLIYDTHELFTEVPELTSRPKIQNIWLKIESSIFPRLKHVITVNDSIAKIYRQKYNVALSTVRNVPEYDKENISRNTRKELNIREEDFILIIQGSGLNKHRGIEEAVSAMEHCSDCVLLLVGDGDVIPKAKKMVAEKKMESKVRFIPRRPYKELMRITRLADLGLLLDKNTSLNQGLALPNKLFDYIHAGIPILSTNLSEISKIIKQYEVGIFLSEIQPKTICETILKYKTNIALQKQHRINCRNAAEQENWQVEQQKLIDVIHSAERNEA